MPLAALGFRATALGESDLILTIDRTYPTQGFVAGPSGPPGYFGSVQHNLGRVTAVPGPGTPALLGALALPAGVWVVGDGEGACGRRSARAHTDVRKCMCQPSGNSVRRVSV